MSTIKRTAIITLSAVLLSACGSAEAGNETVTAQTGATSVTEPEAEQTAPTAETVFDALKKGGLADAMDTEAMLGSETFTNVCPKLYGIEASELTAGGVMFPGAGTTSDEVSVLGGRDGLADILRKRAESRANDFKGYAPEEEKKARRAVVFEHKGLAVLVISDNAEKIKETIQSL